MANLGHIEEIQIGVATALLELKDQGFFENINKAKSALQDMQEEVNKVSETAGYSTDKLDSYASVASSMGSTLTRNVTVPLVNLGKSSIQTFKSMESAFTGVRKTIDETRFEEAFGKNVDGFKILDDAIKEIAQSTNSTYEEVAGVMEWAGQLNVPLGKGGESIIKFTKTMVELGDSTNLTAEQSAESLAKFLNIVQGGSESAYMDVDKLGSTIVDLGNNSATTEADIVSMAMRLAGAGKQIGLTETEILGFASALSSVGITAEMGGSAFSKAMVKMQVAAETGYEPILDLQEKTGLSLREMELMSTNNALGFIDLADSLGMTTTELKKAIKAGNNLNDFAAIANMTTEEFVTLYREDATAALQAFIGGLGDTESHGQTAIAMLDEMGFTEVRLRDVLLRLSGAQGIVSDNIERANEAWGENYALQEEAEKRYATLEAQLNQLNERWKEMKYDIAEALIPVLSKLMDIIEKLLGWWKGLNEDTKNTIVNLGLIAAALGPLLSMAGNVLTFLSNVTTLINGIKQLGILNSLKVLGEGIGGFVLLIGGMVVAVKNFVDMFVNGWSLIGTILEAVGLALAAIGAIILGAPAAIAGVVAGIVFVVSQLVILIKDNWDGLSEFFEKLWKNIVEGWKKFWDGWMASWKKSFDNIANFFKNIPTWINEHIVQPIKDALADGFQLEDLLAIGKALIDGLFAGIKFSLTYLNPLWWFKEFLFKPIIEAIKSLFGIHSPSTVFMEIGEFLIEGLFEGIKNTWDKIVTFFEEAFGSLVEWFKGKYETIKETIISVWETVYSALKEIYDNIVKWFEEVFDGISKWFEDVGKSISDWFSETWKNISDWISDIWKGISEWFDNVGKNISEWLEGVWKGIYEWFEGVIRGISDFFTDLMGKVGEWFSNLGKSISDAFAGVQTIVENIITFVTDAFNSFLTFIQETFGAVIEFLQGAVKDLEKLVEDIVKAVSDFFSDVFETLGELWESVTTFIGDIFDKIFTFVSDKIEELWKWIKEIPGKFVQIGEDIIEKLWKGLKGAWDKIADWFEDKFAWVSQLVEKITGKLRSITAGISEKISGSHAGGLDYVPYNGYIAELHEGERVLTKQEARDYNSGNGSGGDTFNFYNVQPDPYEYARQMKRAKKELLYT